jgi:ankyrin repeat protein
MLVYDADPNAKNAAGRTPLCAACRKNRPDVVKILLSNGADPDLPGPQLPILAFLRNPACLELLISAVADIHTYKGLMELATFYNSIESVNLLLDAGVDPNEKHQGVYTPITTSIRDNRPEILSLLLSRGANPNLKGQDEPLMMATRRPELLKQLLTSGADLARCKGVMEMAVFYNSIESIKLLIDAGVDPNDKKDGIYTPLTTAIRDNHPDILTLLLSHGADPNLKGQDILLYMAARRPELLK